jgi:outer membrane protein
LVSKANIEVTEQQLERTKQLVEAGSLARGAMFEIEAQLAREELQLVNDDNRIKLAYLSLYQFLELPITESFTIEKPTLPEVNAGLSLSNAIDVYHSAMMLRPEIKAAQIRVESANTQLEIAKGYRYPSLTLGANYNNQYFVNDASTNTPFGEQFKNNGRSGIGLNLNIPIFNRNQVKNGITNATLQIDDYNYRLQSARNVLRKDIEQAFTNAVASYNRFVSTEKAVKSMVEAFRYVEEKYTVGMVNTVDYSLQKNRLTLAQSDLLQAKYEYIFRTKILDFYNGIPITL